MRSRIAVLVVLAVVAVAGVVVATVALVQLHSTRDDLHALQLRVGHVANPARGSDQTLATRVTNLESQENFDVGDLKDRIDAIGNVCPSDSIRNYYTRLLGEADAGLDVSVYLQPPGGHLPRRGGRPEQSAQQRRRLATPATMIRPAQRTAAAAARLTWRCPAGRAPGSAAQRVTARWLPR